MSLFSNLSKPADISGDSISGITPVSLGDQGSKQMQAFAGDVSATSNQGLSGLGNSDKSKAIQEQINKAVTQSKTSSAQSLQKQDSLRQNTQITMKGNAEVSLQQQQKQLEQVESLLTTFAAKQQEIGQGKYKAALEQTGFLLRLSDTNYTAKLKREGESARLWNATQMQEALMQSAFSNERSLLESNLQLQALLSADARAFKEELGSIDISFALQMALDNSNAAASQRETQAISMGVAGGAQLAGAIIKGVRAGAKAKTGE